MHRYNIDYPKLFQAVDKKRTHRFGKLSWARIGARIHVGESTLHDLHKAKSVRADILVNILMFLKKPISDFIIIEKEDNTHDEIELLNEEEVSTDAYAEKRS